MPQSERLVLATRYRLLAELGQGANGKVWRAHDELLDRAVAVKELRLPEDLSEAERIVFYRRTLREARAPAQLRTPLIVEVYDVVIEQGRPWIVMELIDAHNLEQLITQQGPLPPERVAHIGRQLLDALGTAHKAGILHRDIKPSNVLLAEGDRVVLTDFGLAVSSGSASITKSGQFMGSPAYVAPEVAAGDKATPRSDLWSLGATLYAAVEGKSPFERGNVIATLSALANEDPPPMQRAGVLEPVITGLLHKSPTRRLTHARAVDRLERAMTGSRSARKRAGRPGPRHRLAITIALVTAILVISVVGGGALVFGMMRDSGGGASANGDTVSAGRAKPPVSAAGNALVVRAVGERCKLFVASPGTSQVIFDGMLHKGEVVQYDAPKLEAVISDASACDVWINGTEQPPGLPGQRRNHQITKSPPRR